jgi:ribosome-associated heat shock protein Hsp15
LIRVSDAVSLFLGERALLSVVERQRLDKWLWHARVVRARTHAAALVEAGHVRVNGTRQKSPGHSLRVDDVLTIRLDRSVRILRVTGFAERRGDAAVAKALYDEAFDVSGGS